MKSLTKRSLIVAVIFTVSALAHANVFSNCLSGKELPDDATRIGPKTQVMLTELAKEVAQEVGLKSYFWTYQPCTKYSENFSDAFGLSVHVYEQK
ncbi:MAG: hypothetical protein KDD35_00045 [Bdellovibrionales bacterium]|nr:hypothetical protein [Bdellovibrionales bacterium]